jgi:uncharacterized protein YijF (DUF1287 family)
MKLAALILMLSIRLPTWAQDIFAEKLSDAALSIVDAKIIYDPSYFSIGYPNGDVPAGKGVCHRCGDSRLQKAGGGPAEGRS